MDCRVIRLIHFHYRYNGFVLIPRNDVYCKIKLKMPRFGKFFIIFLLAGCYNPTSESGSISQKYMDDYRAALKSSPYPKYDPDADNPPYDKTYAPFHAYRYREYSYPRYDPDADNPYYPPSTYIPRGKPKYKYPKFDPEADNPPYPYNGSIFDGPLFDKPMFESY